MGTVFDSVTMRPAAGAVVQLVPRAPGGDPYGVASDARGRYEIKARPGSYFIGFLHATLDSLNIKAPTRSVDVARGASVRANLAIPHPARIVAALCGTSPRDSVGAVVGFLRDARTNAPVGFGRVFIAWTDLVIEKGGTRFARQTADAQVNDDGSFLVCGVSGAGGDAFLSATNGTDTTGAILRDVPRHGLMRQDFSVGGRVRVDVKVSDDQAPVVNAEISMAGSSRPGTTDSAGVVRFPDARAGTQTLEVRAIGYLPERTPVVFAAERDTVIEVRLTSLKRMMDTIQVVAKRLYSADGRGFEQRKRRGFGEFYDEADIARKRPRDVLDLIGMPRMSEGSFVSSDRRGALGNSLFGGHAGCQPRLFIDGMQMHPDLVRDLDFLVAIQSVGGVEVYKNDLSTPAQFRSGNTNRGAGPGCGAVVVWTRAPLPRANRGKG